MLKNGTVLGPLKEGQTLNLECEIRGARPAPTVGWYRSGKRLTGTLIIKRRDLLTLEGTGGRCQHNKSPRLEGHRVEIL